MPVQDVEQRALGEDLYLFHDNSKSPDSCLITAHGLWSATLSRPMRLGRNDVELIFYSAHHHVVEDISIGRFTRGLGVEVERLTPETSPDYLLFKYANSELSPPRRHRHNTNQENYNLLKYSAGAQDTDIISIRNRHRFNPVRFSTVLKTLWAEGLDYTQIHCVFCRGMLSSPETGEAAA